MISFSKGSQGEQTQKEGDSGSKNTLFEEWYHYNQNDERNLLS